MEVKKIIIPEGWEIEKIENSEIILKESKKELPKTWEGCYKLLGKGEFITDYSNISNECRLSKPCVENNNIVPVGLGKPLLALFQLLVCRDVYRQGWKPNWKNPNTKYYVQYFEDNIETGSNLYENHVLSFQSAEIRDKFLKNFRKLIEEAKELI